MPEVIVKAIPDYKQSGRTAKLRLNPNKIEDLEWEIPKNFPTQPVYTDPEVSEVMEIVPGVTNQDTTTTPGESLRTIGPISWFQSFPDGLKEGLS